VRCVRQVVVLTVALGALAFAAPALAGHGEIDEQQNATHLSNVAQTGPTNSDLAFWGDQLYAGNYDGFKIIDISDRAEPETLVDYPCVSIQNDVGVWDTGPNHGSKRLLFTSVDASETTDDCVDGDDTDGVKDPVSPLAPSGEEDFEGIRIFDVTTPSSPIYVKAVSTDCGSHTHTVIPVRQTGGSGDKRKFALDAENPDRVFIYVSSYPLASALDPSRCGVTNADGSTTHNKISIVEVPFADPTEADVLKEVPLHPMTLGFPGQESQGCHDIGVMIELALAAGACQGEGQVWDISDPANPDTQNAARIFNELDMELLTAVFGGMKEAKTAPILAEMDALKAREVTARLAVRQVAKAP